MHLTPAEYVVRVFGGISKTAKALDRSAQSVSKWNQPRKKGGCGGRIPGTLHKPILNRAEAFGLDITHRDFFEGRKISESDLALLDEHLKKIGRADQTTKEYAEVAQPLQKKMVDTKWFKEKIEAKHESLRKLSKLMIGRNGKPLDVSALSLMLRDERKMQIYEAKQISRLLSVPIVEILRRVEMDQDMCEEK